MFPYERLFGFIIAITLLPSSVLANSPQNIDMLPLRDNQKIIEQKVNLVDQKSAGIGTTTRQIEDLQAKKQSLAKQLEDESRTINELHQKIADKKAAEVAKLSVPTVAQTVAGNHADWMRAAGIAESDFVYVDYIIDHESGWGVTKWNFSGSGAYGLGQAIPASKMAVYGADYMTNPITQLRWANAYSAGRYGGWANAHAFWLKNRWW